MRDPTSPIAVRAVVVALGGLLLAAFAFLSVEVYRAGSDDARIESPARSGDWILGPPGARLTEAAQTHIDRGLVLLQDRSLTAAARVASYREELALAEELLVRSLANQPSQAGALARLAAVRWELAQPADAASRRRAYETIALASEMASTAPAVQLRLGELLLRMASREEATVYLRRAAELEPELGPEIVDLMRRHLFGAAEILALLPREPEVLAALGGPFSEDGSEPLYLEAVEGQFESARPGGARLLVAYGNACLAAGRPERLRERMDRLGPRPDAESEAERLRQRSLAHLALGATDRAVEDAREARRRRDAPHLAEHLGNVLLATGSSAEAIGAYRESLAIVAGASANPRTRARLYRKIGQAEELLGDVGRAYDAYRLALDLVPDERHARQRVETMESAAGVAARRDE